MAQHSRNISAVGLDSNMRVLHVNTTDSGGGAALVASSLHRIYSDCGVDSSMVVGSRTGLDDSVTVMSRDSSESFGTKVLRRSAERHARCVWLRRCLRLAADPALYFKVASGIDHYGHRETKEL